MLKASNARPNRIQPREKWKRGGLGEAPLGAGGGVGCGRSGGATLRLSAPESLAPDRDPRQQRDPQRQQPPRLGPLGGQDPPGGERDRDPRRHCPVVADDEVPPELPEGLHVPHALASAGLSTSHRRRSARTISQEKPP